ncbi:MAG: histidine--tRNA ligase [bacterium]
MNTISNLPPKGTYDWFPEEYKVRKYIFDTWRKVCVSFGYEEYLTPIIESADVYRAKSGEDIGGKELMVFRDRGNRELSIRPEMTPSVTRMVSRIYNGTQKPIRLFSIANFFRNEKPQRGRNREFWQLNYDVFGSNSLDSDLEVLMISLEIMLAFNPPAKSFVMNINNRKLIDFMLKETVGDSVTEELKTEVLRTLDKFEKLSKEDFKSMLVEKGVSEETISKLILFMESKTSDDLAKAFPNVLESDGFKEITTLISKLTELGYGDWIDFKPNVIRGFDYYDGMVFEVFDNNPLNTRSMFGGGRYNGLGQIFGSSSFPAVGSAPGDETTKLFLEANGLIEKLNTKEESYFLPILNESLSTKAYILARKLRSEGKMVITSSDYADIGKALSQANKKQYTFVIILGEEELKNGKYKVKDMNTREEIEIELAK